MRPTSQDNFFPLLNFALRLFRQKTFCEQTLENHRKTSLRQIHKSAAYTEHGKEDVWTRETRKTCCIQKTATTTTATHTKNNNNN